MALRVLPVLAVIALSLLALGIMRRTDESALPGGIGVGTPQACASLAREYRESWHDHVVCSVDEDCAIEPRGGEWFELDGCWRVASRIASLEQAESVAQQWLALGCAHDYEICPSPGRVGCRFGRCAEVPPAHIPADWLRVDLGRVLSFHVPPEMVRQPAHGEDSVVRVMASPHAALIADLGEWSNPLHIERHPDADSEEPEWALIAEQDVAVGGVKARRVAARNIFTSACHSGQPCRYGWRYQLGLHVAEAPYQGLPTLLLQHPKLTIVVLCDAFADCLVADTVFASLTWW